MSVFNYLYFRNRTANFVEIFAQFMPIRWYIKVAKSAINSDKLSSSYDDL